MKIADSVLARVDAISDNTSLSVNMMPTSAKVEICGKCTLACEFCYQKIMKRNNERQKAMSIQQFIEVIKFLKQIGSVKELGLFYMGESALNKDLAAFCKLAKEEGFFTFLTTNGTVLRTVVEAIPYIDSLKVSWNYKSQEDFIKKTNASDKLYRTIKENIAVFKGECNKHQKKLTVSTVLDSPISEYMEQQAQLVRCVQACRVGHFSKVCMQTVT